MKHKLLFVLLTAMVVALIVPQSVQANGIVPSPKPFKPAAGSWSWDNEDVTGTVIPQYQLAPTNDDDYALLQSAGLHVNGAAQLCHPYPGGQHGWNAEIRVLTNTGWQPVPTVNQWVPDEEGKFMTCAQTWYSGTYAVFGYWVKPEGWGSVDHSCADLPEGEWEYVSSAAAFPWYPLIGNSMFEGVVGDRCSTSTDFFDIPGSLYKTNPFGDGDDWMFFLLMEDHYCACDSVYQMISPLPDTSVSGQ